MKHRARSPSACSAAIRFSAVVLAAFSLVNDARAGEFNETGGVAIRGYDPVAYLLEQRAAKGSAEFSGEYKGSVFHFKSAANRDLFLANPDRFAPQYAGYCAFGVSRGYKADAAPDAFTIADGKLYLNYNKEVQSRWSADMAGHIARGNANWHDVEKTTKVFR